MRRECLFERRLDFRFPPFILFFRFLVFLLFIVGKFGIVAGGEGVCGFGVEGGVGGTGGEGGGEGVGEGVGAGAT